MLLLLHVRVHGEAMDLLSLDEHIELDDEAALLLGARVKGKVQDLLLLLLLVGHAGVHGEVVVLLL